MTGFTNSWNPGLKTRSLRQWEHLFLNFVEFSYFITALNVFLKSVFIFTVSITSKCFIEKVLDSDFILDFGNILFCVKGYGWFYLSKTVNISFGTTNRICCQFVSWTFWGTKGIIGSKISELVNCASKLYPAASKFGFGLKLNVVTAATSFIFKWNCSDEFEECTTSTGVTLWSHSIITCCLNCSWRSRKNPFTDLMYYVVS